MDLRRRVFGRWVAVFALVLVTAAILPAVAGAAPAITGATLSALHAKYGPTTVPLAGATFDACQPTLKVTFSGAQPAVPARTGLWIDGKRVKNLTVSSTGLSAPLSLTAGSHTARVLVADAKGRGTTATYAFTIRCPRLEAKVTGVFRDALDSSVLHVKWAFANVGTAEVWETRVAFTADQGVTYLGDVRGILAGPSFVYSLAPGGTATAETIFKLPAGVTSFRIGYRSVLVGGGLGGVWDDFLDSHPLFTPGSLNPASTWNVIVP